MFVVKCLDKAGAAQLRLDNRPAHLDFLKANADKYVLAGPLLSDDRQSMIGSLLVLDFPDRPTLDEFLAQDPFVKAGLFQSVEILPFKKVLPQ